MKTIYHIQGNYQVSKSIFASLSQLLMPDDVLILLGESILAWLEDAPKLSQKVYILQDDIAYFEHDIPSSLTVIDDEHWAELIVQYERCVRLI